MFTHVSFVSLPVEDVNRARDFYRDRLGMAVTVDEPYGDSRWIMLEMRDAKTRLHLDHRPERIDRTGQPALPLITADGMWDAATKVVSAARGGNHPETRSAEGSTAKGTQ